MPLKGWATRFMDGEFLGKLNRCRKGPHSRQRMGANQSNHLEPLRRRLRLRGGRNLLQQLRHLCFLHHQLFSVQKLLCFLHYLLGLFRRLLGYLCQCSLDWALECLGSKALDWLGWLDSKALDWLGWLDSKALEWVFLLWLDYKALEWLVWLDKRGSEYLQFEGLCRLTRRLLALSGERWVMEEAAVFKAGFLVVSMGRDVRLELLKDN